VFAQQPPISARHSQSTSGALPCNTNKQGIDAELEILLEEQRKLPARQQAELETLQQKHKQEARELEMKVHNALSTDSAQVPLKAPPRTKVEGHPIG
jgi:hypothetical protein